MADASKLAEARCGVAIRHVLRYSTVLCLALFKHSRFADVHGATRPVAEARLREHGSAVVKPAWDWMKRLSAAMNASRVFLLRVSGIVLRHGAPRRLVPILVLRHR